MSGPRLHRDAPEVMALFLVKGEVPGWWGQLQVAPSAGLWLDRWPVSLKIKLIPSLRGER